MNKKTTITAYFLYTLCGVSSLLVIKIINDPEFQKELAELVLKYSKKKKPKKNTP